MPHSLAKLHIHLVFSTKQREPFLHDGVRDALHKYITVALRTSKCTPILVNSVDDHVHMLFELGRTVTISYVVEEIKKASSKWIKTQGEEFLTFRWQIGYGAFAVSASDVTEVREYIANQQEHHLDQSFTDEYRKMLQQQGVTFDEKYVWD